MKHTALIVEHDSETVETIVDILDSLGHKFDATHSQSDAMKRVQAGDYSYILLDLEIPARTRTGRPRIQNTENFLERLGQEKSGDRPPVIVMSSCQAEDTGHTVEMMRLAKNLHIKGATDFIGRPFPTAGRTLDRVIKKVLGIKDKPSGQKAKPKSVERKISKRKSLIKKEGSPPPANGGTPEKFGIIAKALWNHVPNEPITLNQFMAKFCSQQKGTYMAGRRKALLAADRNKSVMLPAYVKPWTRGQAKKYLTHDLLDAWPSYFVKSLVPPLLPIYERV
ncbi:MAG: hypothetical protein DRP83_08560 [Planctomycetota bacterium]|nr:MAG: hypothetical protein DRP83_08560 [Planctomycetota bacterium]